MFGETPDAGWITTCDATLVGTVMLWPFEKVTSLIPFPRCSTAVAGVVVSGAATAPAGRPEALGPLGTAGAELAGEMLVVVGV